MSAKSINKRSVEIVPAILPQTFSEIQDKVEQIKGSAKIVQIDICDGHFVPSFTWPYKKLDDHFDRILREEDGLPEWEDIDYEFDLMVDRPEEVVSDWITAGAARIILHAEAKGDLRAAFAMMKSVVEAGLALNIDTPIDEIEKYIETLDFVQLMGIDNVGFQGQVFDTKVIEKIKAVKARYPSLMVSIDGGVSLENAASLIEAGADRLVIGSAIFNGDNIYEAIERFKAVV